MELAIHALVTSVSLIALGVAFIRCGKKETHFILKFPRSKKAAFILMTLGASWFLYRHVLHLSEADFGEYKLIISMVTIFVFISSFVYTKDFLAVRGLSVITLLYAREVLDAAYLHESTNRLFLVAVTYLLIILALYFGAWPFRMRDFLSHVFSNGRNPLVVGSLMVTLGIPILFTAFSF